MWVYLLLLIIVLLLLIGFIIYITKLAYKTTSKLIKNKVLARLLSLIPIILLSIGISIDSVNAIVVDMHLIVLTLLIKIVIYPIKKLSKKETSEYIIFGLSILLTTIILTNGYYRVYNVVETKYQVHTTKKLNKEKFRIVQISDSHLGNTISGKGLLPYINKINKLNPDIVVITGDFVDDNTSYRDMVDGSKSLGKLKTSSGVYFIYGNHDKGYYNNRSYNDQDIRRELKKNNITILEDENIEIGNSIVIIGRKDREETNRKDISELVKDINKDKYTVVLNHQPNDYENEKKVSVDLVLSGHTHGGQLFPLGPISILLGANDKYYGMEKHDNTTFIVNSGISDWAIKFKTGTKSEYTVIDINK